VELGLRGFGCTFKALAADRLTKGDIGGTRINGPDTWARVRQFSKRRTSEQMKKIMSLMLGLTLLTGTATVAFSQTDTDKEKEGKKGDKKGTDTD
jgi:hypothetical protein